MGRVSGGWYGFKSEVPAAHTHSAHSHTRKVWSRGIPTIGSDGAARISEEKKGRISTQSSDGSPAALNESAEEVKERICFYLFTTEGGCCLTDLHDFVFWKSLAHTPAFGAVTEQLQLLSSTMWEKT